MACGGQPGVKDQGGRTHAGWMMATIVGCARAGRCWPQQPHPCRGFRRVRLCLPRVLAVQAVPTGTYLAQEPRAADTDDLTTLGRRKIAMFRIE